MNLRIDTLGKKIGLGYTVMTAILALSVLATIYQVRVIDQSSDQIRDLRQPSSRADMELLNGINRSVAELRGWMLLEDDTFRTGRQKAWKEEVLSAVGKLQSLSRKWTSSENTENLSILISLVNKLERHQQEVEALARIDPDSALRLMDSKVLPVNKEVRDLVYVLLRDHERLLSADLSNISSQISLLSIFEWIILVLAVIVSSILAAVITRSISNPVNEAVVVAQNIGKGNLETEVDVGGSQELNRLGSALVAMRDSLRQKNSESQRYEWLTTGQNKLYQIMRDERGTKVLASDIVRFLAEYTDSHVGALYLRNGETDELLLAGKYSLNGRSTKMFKIGEGLVGQAAANCKSLLLENVGEDNLVVRTANMDVQPTSVLAAPFLYDGRTLGVVELARLSSFDEGSKEFLESTLESIAIALYSSISSNRVKELLEETQQQSEELQQQQAELEQTNEELEEQAQKLKEQQDDLQAANEELEEQSQVVQQKNHDLERVRTEVEHKAKQLEISSRYKSEFLANMSHELRTPLNSLLILSKDLINNKERNLNDEQVESAEIIYKSGHDLLNLINEILDLSKIESGKMELNLSQVSFSEVARDLERNFKRVAEEKGIGLVIQVDELLPEVIESDKQRLDQIMKNLISNAIKFTPKGSVTVTFQKGEGHELAIAVKDTGIGISKEKQLIVFEAFQQEDGSTARKYGGTGLGLSISRELAKLLGGSLSLESSPGEGSTFTLHLPLQGKKELGGLPSPKAAPLRKKSTITDNSSSQNFIGHPTIEDHRNELSEGDRVVLIIEDDENFARVLGQQAKEKGFKFISASSGEDGLLLAGRYQPHAIILDIELPGIDGHAVLKELKGNPEIRHIPVHIISATEKTLDPIKVGAVEYLTKPVSKEQLDHAFDRMEDFISRKMKNLLVIEDDDILRKSIIKLIGEGDVKCYEAGTAKEALGIFENHAIDCVVLDIGLPDSDGFALIRKLEQVNGHMPPVIVYTGKELTRKESDQLREYAETIIVKGVKSEERLLDETALFLHRTVEKLPRQKQQMITSMYDKETMFKGKRVLLVDDDMRNVFALSKVLKEKGLDIIKAENGRAALEALKQQSDVDLVLMDIMMPEMDGYECMQRIRAQTQFKELPIIALTAKAMKEDRRKCIDAGANDYFTKPIDVERLLSLMRIWIRK